MSDSDTEHGPADAPTRQQFVPRLLALISCSLQLCTHRNCYLSSPRGFSHTKSFFESKEVSSVLIVSLPQSYVMLLHLIYGDTDPDAFALPSHCRHFPSSEPWRPRESLLSATTSTITHERVLGLGRRAGGVR